jgi:hypothetical protein
VVLILSLDSRSNTLNEDEMNNLMETVAENMPEPQAEALSQSSPAMTNISIPKAIKRNLTKDLNIEEMQIPASNSNSQNQQEMQEYSTASQKVGEKIRQEFQENLLFVPKITDKKNGKEIYKGIF